ncbi:MAG TPA: hypothetical protein PK151_07325 [Caldisericia bacterium]|nr:hypothetical protein [Caldisericia bacterium]
MKKEEFLILKVREDKELKITNFIFLTTQQRCQTPWLHCYEKKLKISNLNFLALTPQEDGFLKNLIKKEVFAYA